MELEVHRAVIQIALGYTLAGVIIFTAVAVCLSLVGIVEFKDEQQQKTLFRVFVLELLGTAGAFFAGFIDLNPREATDSVIQSARMQALTEFQSASESYYNKITDLIRLNYQGATEQETQELWEAVSGAEGVDRVKLSLSRLEALFEGRLDGVFSEWRPHADALFDLNNELHDSLEAPRQLSWDAFKASDPYNAATGEFKRAASRIAAAVIKEMS